MKHRIRHLNLGRDSAHRIALVKNLSKQLFQYKYLETSEAKAYSFIPYISKFITRLLKSDKINCTRIAQMLTGSDAVSLTNILNFYKKYSIMPIKTNYIRKTKVFTNFSNSESTVIISFL